MRKIDFRKDYGDLYFPTHKQVTLVDVPPMNFAMIDGDGDPNTAPAYGDAIEALYRVSYTAKFALKSEKIADYKVGPLEGLWWTDDMRRFSVDAKERWKWTSMIMQPDVITRNHFASAMVSLREEESTGAGEATARSAARRARGSDLAHRTLLDGRTDNRADPRLHPRPQLQAGGQASRNLLE